MTTCVVTGGAGFLGSHLCDQLLEKGYSVVCVDNLDTGSLHNVEHIRSEKFRFINHDITEKVHIDGDVDFVYHLASPASPIDYARLPLQTLKVGAQGTWNMLGVAKFKRARFLLASTSEVYGDPQVHPQKESYWGHVNPIGPRGVYDEAKRYAEALTMAYHRQQGVDTSIVRIFNTYGSRMRAHDGRAIPTFLRQAILEQPLTVFGDGSQTRSFCFVDDLVRGLIALAESGEHLPVNIGNPDEYTLMQLAEAVIEASGSSSQVVFKPLPVDDPQVRRPDIARAREVLGWQPGVSLIDGLRRTIETSSRERLIGISFLSELSVLITGASGFVGGAVTAEFEAAGYRVTGTSTTGGGSFAALDLNRPQQAGQLLRQTQPDAIVHLAGLQSVPESWRQPALAFGVNTGGTATLLRAIESTVPAAHLLLASTAAVYGDHAPGGDPAVDRARPFEESDPLAPESPYGASKAAAEVLVAESAARTGLAVTIARLFNQFGPDQPEAQLPAGFASSIAAAEADGKDLIEVEVGNPDARRDYTDTRDSARAFRLLAEGRFTGTFNLCRGQTKPLSRLVEGLSQASSIGVGIEHRPERANQNDVAEIAGSSAWLEEATGWQPRIALDETLAAMLEVRRRSLSSN